MGNESDVVMKREGGQPTVRAAPSLGRQQYLRRTAEHGKFRLPKHPDRDDILNALCDETGYKVAEDGSVSCKNLSSYREPRDGNTAILEQASINTNLSLSYQIEVQPETEEELSLD